MMYVVDEWESDAQDDENEDAPDDHGRESRRINNPVDDALENMQWEDCGRVRVDPMTSPLCSKCPISAKRLF